MRLLFISAAFPPMRAGESEHALYECRHLASRGIDVHLLTGRESQGLPGLPFTVHPIMRDWSWRDLPRLVRFVRRNRPDAVMLMYSDWIYNAHPMITFAPTIVKRLAPATPFVTQMEMADGEGWSGPLIRGTRKCAQFLFGPNEVDYFFGTLLRDSTVVISLSEQHRKRHVARLPAALSKSMVIPPPPLLKLSGQGLAAGQAERQALGLASNEFFLVFYGYVDPNKGIETLFRAFQTACNEMGNLKLAMVGGGRGTVAQGSDQRAQGLAKYEKDMLALPDKLGIANNVIWLNGYDSDSDEASRVLYAADACVLPFEQGVTLSRSSLAAVVSHGIPVITTRGEDLETPFRHQENVFLCPPKDPDALALAIRTLATCPELCEKLREGSRRLAREWFSWDRAVDRLLEAMRPHAEVSRKS